MKTHLPGRTRSGRAPLFRGARLVLPLLAAAAATAGFAPALSESAFDRPFYVGAYLGEAGTRDLRAGMERYAELTGKRPAFVKSFHDLDVDFSARGWAGQHLREVARAGSTPYVALDLRWRGAPRTGLLDAINAGRADAELARLARGISSAGTVLVEIGWEMNGRWGYAWQGVENGGEAGPAKFREAYRRVVDVFRREGARNVKWVFAPNVGNALTNAATGERHWNWYGHYHPGERYVDYLGPHGYNGPGVWGGAYQGFEAVFDDADADHILTDMARRWPRTPIIIGEFATQEARGQDKGEWVAGAFAALRRHRNVVGAIWFNERKEADWRIDSSRSSAQAFRAAVADPNVRSTGLR